MADFLEHGRFFIGVNYWASHAGTNMWSDWQPHIVNEDLKRLAGAGVKTLRVFPLWPVFQPITALYGGGGNLREYAFGEESLPESAEGNAGMSRQALDRFKEFCSLADKNGIRLIVGLITGWMSGRLYVPPALCGMNVLTDPRAVIWEVRFVRCFVGLFKNEPAIAAWDLGNECNCMAHVDSAEQAFSWTSQIVGAILSKDQTRPVISGMHSLLPDGCWTMQHQGELLDVLTTHPYAYFTPHCDMDPINSIRTELHATAESLFYRGIGGKPCFVEECGTLGPMFADGETAAEFVRANLFTLWAHDCRGFMWWCAYEQSHLTHPPYNWNAVERELGLFRIDMSKKPVLGIMRGFSSFLEKFSETHPLLPPRVTDGVCILTRGQDAWGVAYMSFILAKQAGMDLEFIYSDQPLPDANLYLIPSICGDAAFTGAFFKKVMNKVKSGASLYLSLESGLLSPFEEVFGMRVLHRRRYDAREEITLRSVLRGSDSDTADSVFAEETVTVPIHINFKLKMISAGAEILGADSAGDPIFTVQSHGKGKVFFLACPLEKALTAVPDAFGSATPPAGSVTSSSYYYFYKVIAQQASSLKAARVENSNIGLTEHIINESKRLLILVNYDPWPVTAKLILKDNWTIGNFLYGGPEIAKNDAAVAEILLL